MAEVLIILVRFNIAISAAILLVIAVRQPARRLFGSGIAYMTWILPVCAVTAAFLPAAMAPIETSRPASSLISSMVKVPSAPILLLWMAGIVGFAVVVARQQRRFERAARDGALGPAVVGVINPRVVKPNNFAERFTLDEQNLILAHEGVHIRRHDTRINALVVLVQCLCWFNPLVHFGARLLRIDQELSCDEAVVSRFPDARQCYAAALVKSQPVFQSLPIGCCWPSRHEHPLLERIDMLTQKALGHRRRIAGVAALGALFAVGALGAWAFQPQRPAPTGITGIEGFVDVPPGLADPVPKARVAENRSDGFVDVPKQ